MFTPHQEVQWFALRLKLVRTWRHQLKIECPSLQFVAMRHYAGLLAAVFTILFNERLKERASK